MYADCILRLRGSVFWRIANNFATQIPLQANSHRHRVAIVGRRCDLDGLTYRKESVDIRLFISNPNSRSVIIVEIGEGISLPKCLGSNHGAL